MTIEVENKTVRECLEQTTADSGKKNIPLQDVDEMESIHYNNPVNNKNKAELKTAGITASSILADSPESVNAAFERDVVMNEKNLLTTKEVAEFLSAAIGETVSPKTVANWRTRKLFGCVFFAADDKRNGACVYSRERVEQLAAVYHKGILGNMYKIAWKFRDETVCLFDICASRSYLKYLEKIPPKYLFSDEVAQVLEVTEKTLSIWRDNGTFVEDVQYHDGTFGYLAARVYAKKAEMSKPNQLQQLENLPDEILNLPRFFECGFEGDPKKPRVTWGDPANCKKFSDIVIRDNLQTTGFNIGDTGFMVLDFDHCFNEYGQFVNDKTRMLVAELQSSAAPYAETSMSGRGLHMLFRPKFGEFGKIHTTIELGDGVKLEIFYTPENKSIHFTGNVFGCDAKTPPATNCAVIHRIINEYEGRQFVPPSFSDSENVGDTDTARELLKYIPCPHNGENYSLWLHVGMALHHNGNAFEDWLNWSRTAEPDVSENELLSMWKCFDKPCSTPITIATLYKLARDNGYKPSKVEEVHTKEIDDAVTFLKNLNKDNLTREIVRDKQTIRYAALCYEYDKESVADDFIDLAVEMNFANINRRDLERDIKRCRKEIRRELAQAKARNIATVKSNTIKRLESLRKQKPSPTRDTESIKLINKILDWNVNPLTGAKINAKATAHNAEIIFSYDPLIDNLFGYDEFTDKIVFLKKPRWKAISEWRDVDDAQLRFYLRTHYGEFSNAQLISDTLTVYAQKRSFHKVKQYLEDLKWDGVPRADTLFIKFLGVEDSVYSREVTMKWLLGAIARIYHEGCDFQFAVVLQGAQGIGKSYIAQQLGVNWHVSLVDSLDDPHAIDSIQSAWIAEIEEWAGGRKAEINAQKSFLTRSVDTRRAAYARREENTPRHCVFIITVNDTQFLRDPTGNRRFKILECKNQHGEIVEGLNAEYINQVWAETKAKFDELFKNGFDAAQLRLSHEVDRQAEEIAENFTLDDGLTTEIKSYLDIPIPRQAIWLLMSIEERRKFIMCGRVFFSDGELFKRLNTQPVKLREELHAELEDAILEGEEGTEGNTESATSSAGKYYYGKELRQHICATEIYNECFGQDRRKTMTRISEVLSKLEDWQVGKRLRNKDPRYKDQRKPYYRVVEEQNTQDNEGFEFEGEYIPSWQTPF